MQYFVSRTRWPSCCPTMGNTDIIDLLPSKQSYAAKSTVCSQLVVIKVYRFALSRDHHNHASDFVRATDFQITVQICTSGLLITIRAASAHQTENLLANLLVPISSPIDSITLVWLCSENSFPPT